MRKSEITIETRETWVIRGSRGVSQRKPAAPVYCPHCAAVAIWQTPGEAARMTGQSLQQIFSQMGQGQIHFLETRLGQILLCFPSLLQANQMVPARGEDASAPMVGCD